MGRRAFQTSLVFALACMCLAQEPASTAPAEQKEDRSHQKAIESDKAIGAEYAKEIEKDLKFSEDTAMIERVQRIGKEFADIANAGAVTVTWGDSRLSKFDYKFYVVKDKDVNAFSVPGGYIYVYEGLVNFAETDDELASVIAHEVAHASLRHIATMQREQSKFDPINLAAIIAAIWSRSNATSILVPTQLLNLGVRSGWSVNAEKAADFAGVQYMSKSKYSPLGALTFMERLGHENRFKPEINWGIYETHPPTEERATDLVRHLSDAKVRFNRSTTSTSLRASNKIGDVGIELWYGKYKIFTFSGDDAQLRADRAVDRLNAFCDTIPELYDIEVKDENAVIGKRRPLFAVTEDDALAQGRSRAESIEAAVLALKSALFDLKNRVWTERLRPTAF